MSELKTELSVQRLTSKDDSVWRISCSTRDSQDCNVVEGPIVTGALNSTLSPEPDTIAVTDKRVCVFGSNYNG